MKLNLRAVHLTLGSLWEKGWFTDAVRLQVFKVRDILKWSYQFNARSTHGFARLHKLQAKPNGQQIVQPIRLSPAWVGNCFPLQFLTKRYIGMTLNWEFEQVHTSETIMRTGIMCSHLVLHSNPSMILAAVKVSSTEHQSCRSLMDKFWT